MSLPAKTAPTEAASARITFGSWLKAKRSERGLSQSELARILNCGHYTFVATIEAGRRPLPFGYAEPLANALGLEPRDLATRMLGVYEPHLAALLEHGQLAQPDTVDRCAS